ncbi:MAG TPA: ABC-type transport auxiliary lipoprotein family protein [Candidatus Binatia bacterium]|jgi:cholesterol transport system auxiliary component
MKHLSRQVASGIALFVFFCSGCVSLDRSSPERHYFVIELPQSANSPAPSSEIVLSVSNMRISPRFADRSFVYRTSDTSYESDFYNQFLTYPDAMITEELRKGLVGSRQFKYVLGPADAQQPNYVLEGSVNALYGDFRNPSQPAAVLGIECFLYNENSNSGLVAQKHYLKSVTLNGRSPEALVKGWDQALQEIIAALAADLNSMNLVSRSSSPPASPGKDTNDAAESR